MKNKSCNYIFFLFLIIIIINLLSMISTTKAELNPPISIDRYSTHFKYGSHVVNESVELTVAIINSGKNATLISININGTNLIIFPDEDITVNVPGLRTTNFNYYVTSNKSGDFQIIINLYVDRQSIDFHTLSIEFSESLKPTNLSDLLPKNVTPYEFKIYMIYVIAIFLIILSYFRAFVLISLKDLIILYIVFGILAIAGMESLSKGLESIISSNVGRVEPILLSILVLSVAMLILIVNKKTRESIIIANITIFLIPLSFVLDWLIPPTLYNGWYVIASTVASSILSLVLDKCCFKFWKKSI